MLCVFGDLHKRPVLSVAGFGIAMCGRRGAMPVTVGILGGCGFVVFALAVAWRLGMVTAQHFNDFFAYRVPADRFP